MKKTIVLGLLFFVLMPFSAYAADGDVSVSLLKDNGTEVMHFQPFGEDYRGGASIASGDLGADGVSEIIVGSGPGLSPLVKVFRQDGSSVNEFLAYGESFTRGVNVAMCDLDGNGTQEIVTGAMEGGGPHVRIFSADGDVLYRGGFFAYASDFRGGVNVACGDVDGDGRADIVTGAGLGGGPHVKVFDPYGNMKYETFAGGASENTGASVAVGDIDGNGDMEIIAGRMGAGAPTVMVFNKTVRGLSHLIGFNAFENYEGGIQVSAADIDGDGKDELGVATSKHETGLLRYFDINGSQTALLKPFDTATEKGLVAARVNVNGSDRVLAVSQSARDTNEVGKYIRVDISEQRLYAYENGALANSFLVSTGLYSYPTPLGKTSVMDKLLWHDYVWSYGLNNPDNYNLPNVKFNLRIYPHIYIHYAYWHHNFGHRMSHGCINVGLEDSEWIFNWANVGTSVEIVP